MPQNMPRRLNIKIVAKTKNATTLIFSILEMSLCRLEAIQCSSATMALPTNTWKLV